MKILYITALASEDENSGRNLIDTFHKIHQSNNTTNINRKLIITKNTRDVKSTTKSTRDLENLPDESNHQVDLLICHQGEAPELPTYNAGQIILYSLESGMNKFSRECHDIIPHFYGGEATKHCHPDLMAHPQNRVLIYSIPQMIAISHGWNSFKDQYDLLIWIDSKCYFKNKLPYYQLFTQTNLQTNSELNPEIKPSLYYYQAPNKLSITRSKCQDALEIRFLAFTKESKIIPELIQQYQRRKFEEHPIWTPPYLLKKIMTDRTDEPTQDLGKNLSERARVPFLDSDNPLYGYLCCHF